MYSKVFRALKLCVTLSIQIMAIIIKIRETVPLPGGRCGHWNQNRIYTLILQLRL